MALAAYAKHFYPLGLPIGLGALPKSEIADAEQTHKEKIHLVAWKVQSEGKPGHLYHKSGGNHSQLKEEGKQTKIETDKSRGALKEDETGVYQI